MGGICYDAGMLSRYDQREILTGLHAGVLEKPLWSSFLERLARGLGADGCALNIGRQGEPAVRSAEFLFGRAEEAERRIAYAGRFHALDPIPYDSLRPGRVYALDEFLLAGDAAHRTFFEEYVLPAGRRFYRLMRIEAPAGLVAWLTIWSADHKFSAADLSFLADLAPHLAIALDIHAALEGARGRSGEGAEADGGFGLGSLSLGRFGQVLAMDWRAEALLRRTHALRIHPRGRLLPALRSADRELAEALGEFVHDPRARARAVRLGEDPWLEMLLVPAGGTRDERAVATAYLHGDLAMSVQRIARLTRIFRLTPSEARLAWHMARGRSIAQAAEVLGISEQTARSYSKLIYGKTGASGQADLVRIVLASAIAPV